MPINRENPETAELELEARLLHRDGMMLVIDKPAGWPVHRGPKGGPSLEDYFGQLTFGLPRAPALAHRLDKDTSGCLVLGRHRKALELLGKLFKRGAIEKTYWAVVEGGPTEELGEIDLALSRLDAQRGWWMQTDPAGLPARTSWRVLGRGMGRDGAPVTWLALRPHTGRTHQLRVHAQAMGWPILGDPVYGSGREPGAPPLHLHAQALRVPLKAAKPPIEVQAPAPAHMREALAACGAVAPTA